MQRNFGFHQEKNQTKGFTLIELLIVIGIVAALSVTVIIVINPVEVLRESRDSKRISDLSAINAAIALYAHEAPDGVYSIGNGANCYGYPNIVGPVIGCGGTNVTTRFEVGTGITTQSRAINGTGWIPINFASLSFSPLLSNLPVDPINDSAARAVGGIGLYYAYRPGGRNGAACTTGTACTEWELNAMLESKKYTTAPNDIRAQDGGGGLSAARLYEVGTSVGLNL